MTPALSRHCQVFFLFEYLKFWTDIVSSHVAISLLEFKSVWISLIVMNIIYGNWVWN